MALLLLFFDPLYGAQAIVLFGLVDRQSHEGIDRRRHYAIGLPQPQPCGGVMCRFSNRLSRTLQQCQRILHCTHDIEGFWNNPKTALSPRHLLSSLSSAFLVLAFNR